ncbi:peptidoglycan DD-metalloendopeptidase family protein [Chloroflexus sp.]|uniref:peptidoglycan DD-metalloendopeptidase family protein n=1 Tax=Chloroflexus sp. TaxID=1904827 RepID=UPI003C739DA2
MQTLRQLRRSRHLTFVDLALLTGIPARTIAEAEYGLRHLSRPEAETLALVLGLSTPTPLPSLSRHQAQSSVIPWALMTGLAAVLSIAPLMNELLPDQQRHLYTPIIVQAGEWLVTRSLSVPPPMTSTPTETTSEIATESSIVFPLSAGEALAPLIAPAPRLPHLASNKPSVSFYLDENGPHGCPVQPTAGQVVITQGYGIGSHTPVQVWGAIDLAVDGNGDGFADPGSSWYTPVIATHPGKVKVTLNSYPAGNHVWVVAPDGTWRTGYSHLAVVMVIDGQQVQAGEVIGLMGDTGVTSGPHLDYQVWRGDTNIDPTPLVGCGLR